MLLQAHALGKPSCKQLKETRVRRSSVQRTLSRTTNFIHRHESTKRLRLRRSNTPVFGHRSLSRLGTMGDYYDRRQSGGGHGYGRKRRYRGETSPYVPSFNPVARDAPCSRPHLEPDLAHALCLQMTMTLTIRKHVLISAVVLALGQIRIFSISHLMSDSCNTNLSLV